MLDQLLGRADLKARIEELEEEKGHLEARLEAESERRADAVSERQTAEERVNRLEDRIAELEGRIERLAGDDAPEREFRRQEELGGRRLREVLSRLRAVRTDSEGALTAMVTETVPDAVAEAFGDRSPLVRRAAPCLALTDDAGLVAVTLDPPCPPAPFVSWGSGFDLDASWFTPADGDVLALVRSDLFAVGQYQSNGTIEGDNEGSTDGDHGGAADSDHGGAADSDHGGVADSDHGGVADGDHGSAADDGDGSHRDESSDGGEWRFLDGFESDVKGAHSKGGFSQGRFERRRDAQIDEHTEACLEALERVEAGRDGARLVVVGERTVLGAFEDADYRARVDASGDPRAAFETAVAEFFTTRLSLV